MDRDPRIDPMPDDEIQQRASGMILRVVAVWADSVAWQRKTRRGWQYDNAWTLRGWREMVASNSTVLKVATAGNRR